MSTRAVVNNVHAFLENKAPAFDNSQHIPPPRTWKKTIDQNAALELITETLCMHYGKDI